jgi:hypothetical protein
MSAEQGIRPFCSMSHYFKMGSEKIVTGLGKEVIVLKKCQYAQVCGNTGGQPYLFSQGTFRGIDTYTIVKIGKGREQEDHKEQASRFIVKENADQEKVYVPERVFLMQPCISCQNSQEKDPEIQACEDQRILFCEEEYVFKEIHSIQQGY